LVDVKGATVDELDELLLAQERIALGQQYSTNQMILNQASNRLTVRRDNILQPALG